MKTTRKILALVLVVMMTLALAVPAFADDEPAASGSITILNAVKGTEYKLYKVFDASVGDNGAIVYLAPDDFEGNDYFEVDDDGYVTATEDAVGSDGNLTADAIASLADLVENLTAVDTKTADGTSVVFTNLDFGYYYVETSLGDLVTIDTVDKAVVLYEKNTTTPDWHPEDPEDPDNPAEGKTIYADEENVEEKSFNFGDTVTFQIKIDTVNFVGDDAKDQITSYLIGDDFPAGLQFVGITSVTVGTTTLTEDEDYVTTDGGFPIKVLWVDFENGPAEDGYYTSLYAHGSLLTVTYTATLLDTAVIDGDGNVNTASFNYKTYDPENPPTTPDDPEDPETPDDGDGTTKTDTATVYTYALVIKKIDPEGNALSDATFSIAGLQTTGSAGAYNYSCATAASGTDTEMATDANGILIVKGVAEGDYSITEVKAPDGYNKLTSSVSVTAEKTGATTTTVTKYLDDDGNVTDEETDTEVTYTNDNLSAAAVIIVNKSGVPLPATGGIGTTLFITFGMIAMLGAGVFLVTNKRMAKESF